MNLQKQQRGSNRTFTRIETDIISPINHMSSICCSKILEKPYHLNSSIVVKSLLIEAIKLNQVTIGEFDEFTRNVSKYQKEHDKIGTSLLKEADKQELRKMFGSKLDEFVNSLIENLEMKIEANTSVEKERLIKKIDEL
ncbi:MAG: hypothetical protein RR595_05820 [Lysinibacillus sp.]